MPRKSTKYLVINRGNFRHFLSVVVGEPAADDILKTVEKHVDTVDLEPGDRIVKRSDLQAAFESLGVERPAKRGPRGKYKPRRGARNGKPGKPGKHGKHGKEAR